MSGNEAVERGRPNKKRALREQKGQMRGVVFIGDSQWGPMVMSQELSKISFVRGWEVRMCIGARLKGVSRMAGLKEVKEAKGW